MRCVHFLLWTRSLWWILILVLHSYILYDYVYRNYLRDITFVKPKERISFSVPSLIRTILQLWGKISNNNFRSFSQLTFSDLIHLTNSWLWLVFGCQLHDTFCLLVEEPGLIPKPYIRTSAPYTYHTLIRPFLKVPKTFFSRMHLLS